ncbi:MULTISPECIES: four helix bundle suffix domain-containing protein [Duncaniella]|jgi:four helix bundle suffix protein|uniref:Four helix bundle protein n=1 Tax=Duncaniella muris TaxID=2094150 RepID=A0A2V1IID5_9BACT|nr:MULTISPECIES: four helix bundle suffix domain-containing protein [Duncaniella]NBH92495.1 four helix bundle protein [Muribaculaceae bacterium S4]NBI20954.1 four helix bundle protein [Muribaculaceae bacterium Z1]ROS91874.1 four helix bundle protein [Muribaculaceae bacterium Isolate-039 (Harlan)]ROT00113.1 four helix bundle protein [Muribaculaceae bacterium Isolate-083 (Janvier)]ROT00514.1 four helix bundle protein [Muribaculaceae bacterium Isolate-077 (Janvier)]ROT02819.1 four helix bundle p
MQSSFLPQRGHYKSLIVYQKAECIYDVTYMFAHRFLSRGDRTVDQMIQAARSGKQNIAEGCAASSTSRETEIKLYNVAKASLQELLADYEDFLRVRSLCQWELSDPRSIRTRKGCSEHCDSAFYRNSLQNSSEETIANIAITLIHQVDILLHRLIERAKKNFLEEGGIREQMTRHRLEYRKNNPK